MPEQASQATFGALHRLDLPDALVWLYEIEVPTDPASRIRLAGRHPETVSFRGNDYFPFPVTHATETQNTEGDLNSTALSISNVSREIMTILNEHEGLIDQPVRVLLVNKGDLSGGQAIVQQDYTIRQVSATAETITAQLTVFNPYKANFPATRLTRGHCRFGYRSKGCAYAVPVSDGGLDSCDKTYDGANGCEAHGENELANGYPQIHPRRFGGFLGIPRRPSAGGL